MHIVIPDDYQDCVRTLDCFSKLRGHQVTIHNNSVVDTDALAARFATAELTMLLTLAVLRDLVGEATRLKAGGWQGSLGRQLFGRTLGVFGFGRIGEQVCRMSQAFGAHVLVWGRDSTLAKAQARGFAAASSQSQFFARFDVLSLHLRLTPETRRIVRAADLERMKTDAVLVNTSRAELIEQDALANALCAGRPGHAAVDVFEEEPVLGARHPLLHAPNCLCTPHLGFVEKDNYEAYFASAFDSINEFASR